MLRRQHLSGCRLLGPGRPCAAPIRGISPLTLTVTYRRSTALLARHNAPLPQNLQLRQGRHRYLLQSLSRGHAHHQSAHLRDLVGDLDAQQLADRISVWVPLESLWISNSQGDVLGSGSAGTVRHSVTGSNTLLRSSCTSEQVPSCNHPHSNEVIGECKGLCKLLPCSHVYCTLCSNWLSATSAVGAVWAPFTRVVPGWTGQALRHQVGCPQHSGPARTAHFASA